MTFKLSMLLTSTYVLAQLTNTAPRAPASAVATTEAPRASGTTTTPAPTKSSLPSLALPQTKSADMTIFPPTGTTGVTGTPVTTSGSLSGYPTGTGITGLPTGVAGYPTGVSGYPTGVSGYPTGVAGYGYPTTTGIYGTPTFTTAQMGYSIIPGTSTYQPLAAYSGTGTPPGCGVYRNCLACAQASWYGCGWNPGNGQGPVGCSQTWTASQCTGIASPTEVLAPCAAYPDCASCTNQAGCVFTRAQGCIYSAGPGCLEDPANCVNYPAQCPATQSTYTLPSYNPNSLVKAPYSTISSIYGITMPTSLLNSASAQQYIGTSTGVEYALPLSYSTASLSSSQIPAYFFPGQTTTATTTSVYTPQYVGYGSALPTGTLGSLAGQYYLTSSMIPQTSMVPQTTYVQQNSVQYVPAGATPPTGATPLGANYNPATGAAGTTAYAATRPTGTYSAATGTYSAATGAYPGTTTTGAYPGTTTPQVQYPYSAPVSTVTGRS